MIANIGRIVAGSTSSGYGSEMQIIVESCNSHDSNRLRIKNGLASGDTLASSALQSKEIEWQPLIEQSENGSSERNILWISAQWIIDADKEIRQRMLSHVNWPAV